jgi:hypothetical protein
MGFKEVEAAAARMAALKRLHRRTNWDILSNFGSRPAKSARIGVGADPTQGPHLDYIR